jgi:hypothetical protein
VSALEALLGVVAVYSTHPTAPLALLARTADLQAEEYRALEQQRLAVRIVGMRGSAFLVPAASAAAIFSATRMGSDRLETRLRYGNLDRDTFEQLAPRVLECCSTPLTPAELRECLPVADDVYMVARILARQGRIIRVGASLRTDQLRYVATTAWLGEPLEEIDRQTALDWLALAYVRGFGPIRPADFAWWSGSPRRAAAMALERLKTVSRDGLLLLEEDADAFDAIEPLDPARVDVLPKWDSYTMGYAPDGRQRFVDDRYLPLAYTSVSGSPGATAGDGLPLILRGGRAIASWSHRLAGNQLVVSIRPFEPSVEVDAAVFAAAASLLETASVNVTTESFSPTPTPTPTPNPGPALPAR